LHNQSKELQTVTLLVIEETLLEDFIISNSEDQTRELSNIGEVKENFQEKNNAISFKNNIDERLVEASSEENYNLKYTRAEDEFKGKSSIAYYLLLAFLLCYFLKKNFDKVYYFGKINSYFILINLTYTIIRSISRGGR